MTTCRPAATASKPHRYGNDVQFRWVRRWWLIFPYAVLQFREKVVWRSEEDGMFRDNETWTKWHDVFVENETHD